MAVAENTGLKVDSSGQHSDKNTVAEAEAKPPCPKSDSSVETPNLTKEQTLNGFKGNGQSQNSEVNLKSEISHLDDKFSKLNPMAEEFVPPSLARTQRNRLWFPNNFATQAVSAEENGHFARRSTQRRNFGQGKRKMNKRTNLAENGDVIRRTVYVSDIDQPVTEEQLAGLFLSCGRVVDCRICGDNKSVNRFAFIEFTDEEGARSALRISGTVFGSRPIKVHLSKTAIAPVNPTFLPRSEDECEKCVKTVYCTNIDKKVNQMEFGNFFGSVCGEIQHLRLLGDFHHQTCIAFIEFTRAESAIAALNCSGVVLGGRPVRVSPSKTPVRPHRSDFN